MGTIISIVNNKGGVGKTSTTINLAHALSNRGRSVLVVDLDSQANASEILVQPDSVESTLYELLNGDAPAERCVYPTEYERVSCLPNVEETSSLEFELAVDIPRSYGLLRDRLREHARSSYDYTLIDCPPNLGFYVVNALYASDFVVVPILSGSRFSLRGLTKALALIGAIRDKANPDLRFLRLLVNNVDKRTAMAKLTMRQIQQSFREEDFFDTTIPSNSTFQQAEHAGKSVIRFAPKSTGAKYYRELARELEDILLAPEPASAVQG